MNDNVWRFDDGDLTVKRDLPVTYFVAGDTGIDNSQRATNHSSRVYSLTIRLFLSSLLVTGLLIILVVFTVLLLGYYYHHY